MKPQLLYLSLILGEDNSDEYHQPNQGDPGEFDGLQETQRGTQAQSSTAKGLAWQDSHVGPYQEDFSEPGSHSSIYHREDLGGRETLEHWTLNVNTLIRLDMCLYHSHVMSEFVSVHCGHT